MICKFEFLENVFFSFRNCRNEITVVVWRTMPVMKPYYEGLIHRPSYKTSGFDSLSPTTKTQNKTPPLLSRPSNHKLSRRKKGNSSESPGNGTREPRWSWTGKREENDYKTRTQTLKGTRVTSSNGDNYIILSPVNPGNQVNIIPTHISNHFSFFLMPWPFSLRCVSTQLKF